MYRRPVEDLVNGVEPETIVTIVSQERRRMVAEVATDLVAAGSIEVDRFAPWCRVAIGKVRAESFQIITSRTKVVVNHVGNNHQAAAVTRINQALESLRPAVRMMRRVNIDAVVAPATRAGKLIRRHQLDMRDPKIGQMVQVFDRA